MKGKIAKSLPVLLTFLILSGFLSCSSGIHDQPGRHVVTTPLGFEPVTACYYHAENETLVFCQDFIQFTGSDPCLKEGTYVVSGRVSVDERICCDGNVRLILLDGCTLFAKRGIEVSDRTDSLMIFAGNLSEPVTGNGSLVASADGGFAAIGGDPSGSGHDITILGGRITAIGGQNGAGIGGGENGEGRDLSIRGGSVTAVGGVNAAGIGGGSGQNGAAISLTGGSLTATGGNSASGVGSGKNGAESSFRIDACYTSERIMLGKEAAEIHHPDRTEIEALASGTARYFFAGDGFILPAFIEKDTVSYRKDCGEPLVFVTNQDLSLFVDRIYVDDRELDFGDYGLSDEPVTLELDSGFLDSLDPGYHVIGISFLTGNAKTGFLIE